MNKQCRLCFNDLCIEFKFRILHGGDCVVYMCSCVFKMQIYELFLLRFLKYNFGVGFINLTLKT
jgi:hypothetical protein